MLHTVDVESVLCQIYGYGVEDVTRYNFSYFKVDWYIYKYDLIIDRLQLTFWYFPIAYFRATLLAHTKRLGVLQGGL